MSLFSEWGHELAEDTKYEIFAGIKLKYRNSLFGSSSWNVQGKHDIQCITFKGALCTVH